ncbi:MAG: ATP phosphoribosyltransferase regulatory subunit [Gammaproteobacteria bacterium]|jgi:ATP phosphoribosyltransferase regulatory subunit|nr:ATP phosphoribosyltransferase regulatory subunit [Gammaproteobacteria bacterium]MBT6042845.1 ATP phosphoribosyltransferase regulatory subunit [Gammaproteobacteria bacterium]
MTKANRWLLPDGVDEILPPQANQLETLRRDILDLYSTWGYELVMTPLIEFLDSLLILPSNALQLQTFKIVDQLTGRGMGVRADITSQVARIDSHVLQREAPTRLCYADSVLHTIPQSLLGSRSPLKIGAEIYGHRGIESDIEVISLMLHTLQQAGIDKAQLALGHVNIYRSLTRDADLAPELEEKLFAALQRKSTSEIEQLLQDASVERTLIDNIKSLSTLNGDASVLDHALDEIKTKAPEVKKSLEQLQQIAAVINQRFPEQSLYFDLGELRGYEYHTGVVFAAYVSSYGEAIANGGRYDDIGEGFGRARAATGFDADLKILLAQGKKTFAPAKRIFAPADDDPALQATIDSLRLKGQHVISAFPGQSESATEMGCEFELVNTDGSWQVNPLK